ncbi:MAG TPA: MBL fold metallo-hydrolase [Rhabdochlamydiaceae bacterium]|nr:MBL fold metallo-hydrolase [Rhabdochlamydiaceae bacterium]
MILEVFPSGPLETNAILLGCSKTKHAAIIDAPFDSFHQILQRVKKLGLKVEMILLTHSHWDHIAEAASMKKQLKIPIYIHAEDAGNLESPGADGLPLLFPIEGVKADHFLSNDQIVPLGEMRIKVIHTPGHSPGCVCFYIENEKTLISGDTLFRGAHGKTSFPTSSPKSMLESLKKLSKLPADTMVYPGHGPATTIGEESWMVRQINFNNEDDV